jgi:3-oxoacyl-[acyl-carrier-protein] synthase II
MEGKRVVITGVGAVTPLGLTARESWRGALEGHSGIGTINFFDSSALPVHIAGEVKGFTFDRLAPQFTPKEARKLGRFAHLALAAALEAYHDSGWDAQRNRLPPERFGTLIGSGIGGLPEVEAVHNDLTQRGFRRMTPFFILQAIPNMAAGALSAALDLKGPNFCTVSACASSAHSIGEAARMIQRSDADVILAGGAEAAVCALGIGGFAAMRALSQRNDAPERASRPFDRDRDGFVLGEGAGILVLEPLELARSRGAKIYAEVAGYGLSADAYDMAAPARDAEGAQRAMKNALADAHLAPAAIGYINAHSTSTPAGDVEEVRGIATVFGASAKGLAVSSTKSMTGHTLGAAGAIEAIFTTLAVAEGRLPPTLNLENLDPECARLGINFVPQTAIEKRIRCAMSNSFGFGGTNAVLIIAKV